MGRIGVDCGDTVKAPVQPSSTFVKISLVARCRQHQDFMTVRWPMYAGADADVIGSTRPATPARLIQFG